MASLSPVDTLDPKMMISLLILKLTNKNKKGTFKWHKQMISQP
jgi:hypothetical protein